MKTMAFLLLNSFIWVACATSRIPDAQQIQGTWELTLFPYSPKSFAEIFGERKPTLQFATGAKLTGNTGCNQLSGTYSLDQNNITFGKGIATTKMACAGYEETLFLDALMRVNKTQVQNGNLNLYEGDRVLMVFTKTN